MEILNLVLIFILGSAVGSFLNVVILRLPKGQNLRGRSACPACGKTLSASELVPLLSFLWQKGKCKRCGRKISARYFLIELITATVFLATWIFISPKDLTDFLLLTKWLLGLSVFIAVFVIDWEHYLIFDSVVFTGLLGVNALNLVLDYAKQAGLVGFSTNFFGGIFAALLAALPFFALWFFSKGRWMGFGDVKLALFLGVVFGWPLVLVNLFLAVFSGGIISLLLLLSGKKSLKSQVPFGVFLTFSAMLTIFFGQNMMAWYLSLIGF